MKKLCAILILAGLLAGMLPCAVAEARPRLILLTVYRQGGQADTLEIGGVDEEGGLWSLSGSASQLGWPSGGLEVQIDWLMGAPDFVRVDQLDWETLFDVKGLVGSADHRPVSSRSAAQGAGVEISYALRWDSDGDCLTVRLGMSGDEVFENTDPDAQALYRRLREWFPGVTCYGGEMGPAGFQPLPVADFLGLDADAIRSAKEIQVLEMDCEAGPIPLEEDGEAFRTLALEGIVTGKANAGTVTGGFREAWFIGQDGQALGRIALYEGLLMAGDGMYTLER